MKNSDLLAFLKPIVSQFSRPDEVELLDVTGRVTDIQTTPRRLAVRLHVPAGLYRGRFQTVAGAFAMGTAMIDMVRVPDGQRVPVGPWDLDHIQNVMAMPMMRTYVNGALKGGLWFSMPGPDQIAAGRLEAEFGFEAQEGQNELVLEFVERDQERMDWGRLEFFELRHDDRRRVSLVPRSQEHPCIFVAADGAAQARTRWQERDDFKALCEELRTQDLVLLSDNSQGLLEVACLVFALTGDPVIGARAKERIMGLARATTWSGRPDPLLMGGDNDRPISLRLYHTALGWDYLQPLLDDTERRLILAKAEEYIGKMYDFTLLQRGYMGCPAIDPHSLGAWNGAAIACMAFYADLAIARHALPFFYGLFCDSVALLPDSGKAAWATYFPFHMILALAAAHTFGGQRPELDTSPFLEHLAQALMAAFDVPNSQELQRGLRTREHRFLTAFLCRFHPTLEVESIYRAFAERERSATGQLALGIFDLLYAPSEGPIAAFPERPLYARDVGDVIATVRAERTMAVSLSGGPKAGRRAVFSLMPQNREFAPAMGAFDITVDGTPVICNVNMGQYGLDSALTNTMCFESGGAVTNGQYLNGAVAPERCAVMRRCFIGDRYLYAHVVLTSALDPTLGVRRADRVFILDRKTGVTLLSDAFAGDKAIRFATHLHCSGSVTDIGQGQYRLTGGQANLIAGTKGGSKGLDDAERGEIFVQVLESNPCTRVVVEEPIWVPGYIYGLNNTGQETLADGRFPRYRRWRLEAVEPVRQGAFLLALSLCAGQVDRVEGAVILPQAGGVRLGYGALSGLGLQCDCECLLWDDKTVSALGLRRLRHGASELIFAAPVDMEYKVDTGGGRVYAQTEDRPTSSDGFRLSDWGSVGDDSWRTHNTRCATLIKTKGVEA
jgi:hypothetical protein